jgi:AhpD family alkylhydroperoxidase
MPLDRLAPSELPAHLADVHADAVRRAGSADFIEAGAAAPEILDWYFDAFYRDIFYGGRNTVRTNEIVRLRLANTHGCVFCNRWDTVDARAAGLTEEEIDALQPWPAELPPGVYSAAERAAIAFADQHVLQNVHGHLDDDLHARLKEHFDAGQIFELGIISAVLTGMAKFLFVCDLVPKMDHCPVRPPA